MQLVYLSDSQVIGWQDLVFAPFKWLAGMIVSKIICNVSTITN